ncbi:MAG: hypothetical protein EXR95_06795 [Gemmatimonadetes bacterium]|nr:hypothetical protein [Gemmatimonadota bacterium]
MTEHTQQPIPRAAIAAVGALVVAVLVLVGMSLRRPELPVYAATPIGGERPAGAGPHLLTVDASDPELWRHVDLARGTVVDDPSAPWDLAFRRFEVRVNGGAGALGQAGVLDLGPVALDSLASVPAEGYRGMEVAGRDTTLAALEHWYAYSYTTHVLRPLDQTFAFRTAYGRLAALRFVSYYCPGAQPGCVTLRYRFFDSAPAR